MCMFVYTHSLSLSLAGAHATVCTQLHSQVPTFLGHKNQIMGACQGKLGGSFLMTHRTLVLVCLIGSGIVHSITFLSQLSTLNRYFCCPVEWGIRLGSASVCYNNQQAFFGQLQDLIPYVLDHAISNLLWNEVMHKPFDTQCKCCSVRIAD